MFVERLFQSAQQVCNSYDMSMRDLPDIAVCPSPRAAGPRVQAYISGN